MAPSSPTDAAGAVRPPRRTFAERYRLMRSRWNAEWWSIAFGGPIGNLLNAVIADVPWITPNRLTWLSFLCKLAAGPLLLVQTWRADLTAAALLQLHVILDCMDGSLARYRKTPSAVGAFLDKATDMIGLVAIAAALGWRIYLDTGDAAAILIAMLIAAAFLIRGYVYWVIAHLERERRVEAPTIGDHRRDYSAMTFRERAALYVRSMRRIVELAESDLYFWFGLGIVLGRLRETIYLVAIATGGWSIAIVGYRYWTAVKLDRRGGASGT